MASLIKCFLCVLTAEHQVGPAGYEQHFASFSVPFHTGVGQSPILIDYGQPLFLWLSRD